MKTQNKYTILLPTIIIMSVSIQLFFAISVQANRYSNNNMTIDTEFTTGSLSDTITSLHANLANIKSLNISKGTLNNPDIYWIRDNLPNLIKLDIWDEAIFSNGGLPDNALSNHQNILRKIVLYHHSCSREYHDFQVKNELAF